MPCAIMLIGMLIFQFFPNVLLDLFRSEQDTGDMLTIGVPALRIISLSFLLAGYSVVCSSVFQALGHGVLSLVVSVVRQLVVLLPIAFLLSQLHGLELVCGPFPSPNWWQFAFVLCSCAGSTARRSTLWRCKKSPGSNRFRDFFI